MGAADKKKLSRLKRKSRIRKKISGSQERPRLSVFRSSKHVCAQIIDDIKGQTLATASTYEKQVKNQPKFESKVKAANYVGKLVAERAIEKGIKQIVFDRSGYMYHGRVKAISDGAREAGLNF